MNQFMVIEIIVFAIALLVGLIVMLVLRRKLKDYDGRETKGQKKPPKKIL